jgi:RNA polymerase sigma-70 factor (ECF subfamily)
MTHKPSARRERMQKPMKTPLGGSIPAEESGTEQGMAPAPREEELSREEVSSCNETASPGGRMVTNMLATVPIEGETIETTETQEQTRTFEELFESYYRPLSSYLFRMLGDAPLAQDLTQECFIKLHLAMVSGQQMANVRAWLYRVATNAALDEHRRRKRIAWLPLLGGSDHHDSSHLDPEEHVVLRDRLQQALAGISPNLTSCLLLHLHHGFSHDEIAAMLGISSGAARTRLQRGREAFKARWQALEGRSEPGKSGDAQTSSMESNQRERRQGRGALEADRRNGGSHETCDA